MKQLGILLAFSCCCRSAVRVLSPRTGSWRRTAATPMRGTLTTPSPPSMPPCQSHAQPGDTIYVRAGTYTSLMNIGGDGYCSSQQPNHALIGGAPGARSPSPLRRRLHGHLHRLHPTGPLQVH